MTMRNLFKTVCVAVMVAFGAGMIAVEAQSATLVQPSNSFAWNQSTNTPTWAINGYDLAVTSTNTTPSTASALPSGAGVIGAVHNTGAAATTVAASTVIPSTTPDGPFTVWVRGTYNALSGTNTIVSGWASLGISYGSPPLPPSGLRVQ